jgi:hypothetical protein
MRFTTSKQGDDYYITRTSWHHPRRHAIPTSTKGHIMTRAEFITKHRQTSTVLVYSFGRPSFRITANSKHIIADNCVVFGRNRVSLDGYTVAIKPWAYSTGCHPHTSNQCPITTKTFIAAHCSINGA